MLETGLIVGKMDNRFTYTHTHTETETQKMQSQ